MLKSSAIALTTGMALAALGTGTAFASANQDGWAVSGALNYTVADTSPERKGMDDGLGLRLGVSRSLADWLTLEGLVGFQSFDKDTGPVSQDEISLGLDYQFHVIPQLGALHPYLIAGFGGVQTKDGGASNVDTTNFNWSAGLGVDIPLGNKLGIVADVRHRAIYWDDERGNLDPHEVMVGLGLTYDFSEEKVEVFVVDGDADQDGVPDSLDRCPNTPVGTVVDAYGCPVTEVGDADGDGVPDNMDRCPNTPKGTPVDGEGCPAPETVIIYFAFDSAELNGPAKQALDIVADNLKARSYVVAVANGHADRTGTEAYNQGLSERRAKSVANYLMAAGVPEAQLRTRAFGETRPVNGGTTAEERARNRRVEINLLEE